MSYHQARNSWTIWGEKTQFKWCLTRKLEHNYENTYQLSLQDTHRVTHTITHMFSTDSSQLSSLKIMFTPFFIIIFWKWFEPPSVESFETTPQGECCEAVGQWSRQFPVNALFLVEYWGKLTLSSANPLFVLTVYFQWTPAFWSTNESQAFCVQRPLIGPILACTRHKAIFEFLIISGENHPCRIFTR